MRIGRVANLIALRNQTEIYRVLVSGCMRQVELLEVSVEGKTCFSAVQDVLSAFPRREGASTRLEAPLLPLHQLWMTIKWVVVVL